MVLVSHCTSPTLSGGKLNTELNVAVTCQEDLSSHVSTCNVTAGIPVAKGNKNWGEPGHTLPVEHYLLSIVTPMGVPGEVQLAKGW